MVDKRNSTSVFLKLYFQHKERRALDVLSSINLRITVKEGKKKKLPSRARKRLQSAIMECVSRKESC